MRDDDDRRRLSTARRLNRDRVVQIHRLRGSKNFICKREACIQYVP